MFVGAKGRMEMEKVPQAGYPIEGLWISGIQRRITADNFSFPIKLLTSLSKAGKIIKKFKPDAVVGVGGYASGPLLYRAAGKGIPCLIQEQNSYPGITNKLLARRVDKICVAHDKMDRFFPTEKIVFTGNPVRKDIISVESKKQKALSFFQLDENKPVLFIMGGSLGARTINESVLAKVDQLLVAGVQLIWQTGRAYYEDIKKQLTSDQLKNIRLYEFLKEMDMAYAAAEVVISRAGALSVSELALAQQPVIFIPSPNVTEDHQTKNAMALVEKDAAWMVADKDAKENLAVEALKLLNNKEEQNKLKNNIAAMAKPNAATEIVEEIIKLINK
jgi:UDP-N-acetylglucosamine--N-acetylmuramyl-(pentapeptide) pyrophosphoryl-undecaprenol N-acetylglucosamine transferase